MKFWIEILVGGILQFIGWIVAAVLIFVMLFGPLYLAMYMSVKYVIIYFAYLFALALFAEYLKRR